MNYELKIKGKLVKGFTLVELLIVIAIIGVLSAILLSNFLGVRQRARDAQRKSDLRQIQSALELHRADNGLYPLAIYTTGNCPTSGSFIGGGAITYMQKVPCESNSNGSIHSPNANYKYSSGSSGDNKTYYLYACLENTNDTDPNILVAPAPDVNSCDNGSSDRDVFRLSNP